MKLSDFLPEKTNLIRDGSFFSMGTLFSHNPHQIVYAIREEDVKKIINNPSVSCVITTPSLISRFPETAGIASSQDPLASFYALQSLISQNPDFILPPFANRISPSAKIHPSAVIPKSSVSLGKDVVIEKNVVIHEQTIIEDGTIIRSNSIIGNCPLPSQGKINNGPVVRPSGGVYLHQEVDIHANTQLHRAIFKGYTEVGKQTKIDNLDTIGQGTVIGKRCLLCAGVTIGESVIIGDDGLIGPNVTLENQIKLGNNVYITLGSKVLHDIDDDKVVKDNYAIDRKRFKKVIRGM
jgi:UDP-3-O-[3-hydroxymyristoyl] glucosamine N-acyltransferase